MISQSQHVGRSVPCEQKEPNNLVQSPSSAPPITVLLRHAPLQVPAHPPVVIAAAAATLPPCRSWQPTMGTMQARQAHRTPAMMSAWLLHEGLQQQGEVEGGGGQMGQGVAAGALA